MLLNPHIRSVQTVIRTLHPPIRNVPVAGFYALLQPSVFGLPDNIERSVQRAASSLVVAGLRRLGAASAGAENFDREM